MNFLPGLVAPRVGVVTHWTWLTIDCVLYYFYFTILKCVRYGVITFTMTLSICCQNFNKKFLRRFAVKFFISNGVLYKRNHDSTLLRCIDKSEAERIMIELHEGTFGTHSSGHTIAKKILREGYYWSTMEADCYQHSRTCHKCQVYADKVHVPLVPLNVLTAPFPFAMWWIWLTGVVRAW